VHELMSREKIEGGPDAEDHRRAREEDEQDVVSKRARMEGRYREGLPRPKQSVAERREREDDRQPVEPGVVSRGDQHELVNNDEPSRDRGDRLRREQTERGAELHEVTEDDARDEHR